MFYYPFDVKTLFRQKSLLLKLFAVAVAAIMQGQAATNSLIIPEEYANKYGEGSIALSWPISQLAYPASVFAHAEASQIMLYGLAFRMDESARAIDAVVPRFSLVLSTYRGPWSQIERRQFPAERGADELMVYSPRDVRITAKPPNSPSQFDVLFLFEKPFTYDRNAGHLLVDINVPLPFAESLPLDFPRAPMPDRGRILGQDHGAGGVITTSFLYSPIPEPSVLAILSVAVVLGCIRRWFPC